MGKTKEPKVIYQIKISLDGLSPPVWRRVLTPDVSLELLHFIIQKVMGWDNDHAHHFLVDKKYFVDPEFADRWAGEEDASKAMLSQIVRGWKKTFKYRYDFGDNWLHTIEVEGKVPRKEGLRYPVCIEGENRCPPEDVGGVMRYQFFLVAINGPNHPDHKDWKEWWPEPFDPEDFDLEAVNERLGQMKVE
jgi:hypothetical protein